jgi:hypothetical protein
MALVAPLAVGTWSLQFLSLPTLAVSVIELYAALATPDRRTRLASYLTGGLGGMAALVLYLRPSLVGSGVIATLLLFLVIDGLVKIGQTILGRGSASPPLVTVINGASSLILALFGWWIWQRVGLEIAVGLAVGGYTIGAGWRLLVAPAPVQGLDAPSAATNLHPYARLRLGEHPLLGTINAARAVSAAVTIQTELYWLAVATLVLFVTHLARMQSADTWLGLVSPFVATAGDFLMGALLGAALILPLRLAWRRLTVPLERKAWHLRFAGDDKRMDTLPRWLLQRWTDARLSFTTSVRDARTSVPAAAGVVLRLGLRIAVVFAGMNPIWGFTWYFNTES